jgi:hypothetical protein
MGRINDMRAGFPVATGTYYHVMSLDITQCHDPIVPKLSQCPPVAIAKESDSAIFPSVLYFTLAGSAVTVGGLL